MGACTCASMDDPVERGSSASPVSSNYSLHITDIHPDPHYKTNASVSASCHSLAPHDDPDRAGYLGTPVRYDALHTSLLAEKQQRAQLCVLSQ